jgi:hypothetical protein
LDAQYEDNLREELEAKNNTRAWKREKVETLTVAEVG